jgi:transposase-like protein
MKTNKICPKCGTYGPVSKNGKSPKGVQRFKCPSCERTFILDESSTKHLHTSDYFFKKFIVYMIDDVTLEVISRNLNINIKTAHYYIYLVFHELSDYQSEIKMGGTILIDETFINIREKKYKIYRTDGKDLRGLSFSQLCVIILINLQGISSAKVSSRVMALPEHYKLLFNRNIYNPKLFIHDGNTKHYQFINQFNCEKVNARKDQSEMYSTEIIDSYHSYLKRYLFKHAGHRLLQIKLDNRYPVHRLKESLNQMNAVMFERGLYLLTETDEIYSDLVKIFEFSMNYKKIKVEYLKSILNRVKNA